MKNTKLGSFAPNCVGVYRGPPNKRFPIIDIDIFGRNEWLQLPNIVKSLCSCFYQTNTTRIKCVYKQEESITL